MRMDWPRTRTWSLVLALPLACGDDGPALDDDAGAEGSSTTGTAGDDSATSGPAGEGEGEGEGSTTGGVDPDEDTGDAEGTTGDPPGDSTGNDSSGGSDTGGPPPGTVAACFEGVFVNDDITEIGPDYDQFGPTVGSHCHGTNHQDIEGVQRAVFLGDSVTVGTPPWAASSYWRGLVADQLEADFGLQFDSGFLMDEGTWKGANFLTGQAGVIESGDFASCAEWGARNDDLTPTQIPQCFAPEGSDLVTLVVMTMGGNDISNLTQAAIGGATQDELWAQAEQLIELKRAAVEWLKDPVNFPGGSFVVFANIFEFTDGTGEVESCDVSALAGFDEPVPAPDELAEVVVWLQEQYMDIAVSTGSDMVFMFEEFCGHGFNSDDPTAPCYRGPGNENWFDFTCIHPNPTGHEQLASFFVATIQE